MNNPSLPVQLPDSCEAELSKQIAYPFIGERLIIELKSVTSWITRKCPIMQIPQSLVSPAWPNPANLFLCSAIIHVNVALGERAGNQRRRMGEVMSTMGPNDHAILLR